MMKAIIQSLLTLGLGFLAHQFLPFWVIALVAGLVALIFPNKNSLVSFAAGFAAAALLWGGYAAYLNFGNFQSLAGQLGELFKIQGSYLTWATGWLGGMLGGFGAMTGTLARNAVFAGAAAEPEAS